MRISTPLPIMSSIHNHKNCIINTNKAIKNEATKGGIKLPSINLSMVLSLKRLRFILKLKFLTFIVANVCNKY